jgi:LysM repeat protein
MISLQQLIKPIIILGGFLWGSIMACIAQSSEIPWFINRQANSIEFKSKDELNKLVTSIELSKDSSFHVAHFGDSHVQPGFSIAEIRKALEPTTGHGGRGLIFPYSIAKTYSQYDYTSSYSGNWETANSVQNPPRIPLGLTGFVARTPDSIATFKIVFKEPLIGDKQKIKLFCKNPENGYAIEAFLNGSPVSIWEHHEQKYWSIKSEYSFDSISFRITKKNNTGYAFELFGLYFENENKGMVYNNLGVGGSRYDAILLQKHFSDQIKVIHPDLFILDWGTNDIIIGNQLPLGLRNHINSTIDLIRSLFPKAAILLTTVQDMNRKGKNISSARTFSKLIREIADEKQCLLWDWYQIAGGGRSMRKWTAEAYAQSDHIHLSVKGYKLKGKLLGEAIIKALDTVKTDTAITQNWNVFPLSVGNSEPTVEKDKKPVSVKGAKKTYLVKKGDTLSGIAEKFNTNVKALKKLNGLKSDKIIAGQRLIIRK